MALEALLPNNHPVTMLITLHHRGQLFQARRTTLWLTMSTAPTTSLLIHASSNYWASANADIQAHLERTIQICQPLAVFELMRRTFSSLETTAPALCVLACELVGGSRDQAVAAGSVLHLIHAAASTHEGLLSSAHGQRPRTTGPFEPNIELLTRDGMIPFGFELLARSDHDHDPTQDDSASKVLRVIVEIARVASSQGLVEAKYKMIEEYYELDGDEGVHVEWFERVCTKKHGQLHACAGACGAVLGGGREEEIARLRKYGLYVGMIQGIAAAKRVGIGRSTTTRDKLFARKLRELALKELEDFDQEKANPIASLLNFRT